MSHSWGQMFAGLTTPSSFFCYSFHFSLVSSSFFTCLVKASLLKYQTLLPQKQESSLCHGKHWHFHKPTGTLDTTHAPEALPTHWVDGKAAIKFRSTSEYPVYSNIQRSKPKNPKMVPNTKPTTGQTSWVWTTALVFSRLQETSMSLIE